MEKEFVTYEQALALKELGFWNQSNKPMAFYYESSSDGEIKLSRNFKISMAVDISAPLIQQAFRFFREKYGLYEYIILDEDNEFYFTIYENGSEVIAGYIFFIYEEAEQACLNKLIEIAKDSKQ